MMEWSRMFFTWFRRLLSSGEGLGDSIGAGYRQWDNRLYALEEESDDWEIWEIGSGSGREDRDGWPMLITADETGPGWLPFAVRSAISSSSLLSINFVASKWRHAMFVTLRMFQGETRHHGKIHHLRLSYAECRRMTLMGGSGQQS
jgi:hypothetical protein